MYIILALIYIYGVVKRIIEEKDYFKIPIFWSGITLPGKIGSLIGYSIGIFGWPIIWVKNAVDFHLDQPYSEFNMRRWGR